MERGEESDGSSRAHKHPRAREVGLGTKGEGAAGVVGLECVRRLFWRTASGAGNGGAGIAWDGAAGARGGEGSGRDGRTWVHGGE